MRGFVLAMLIGFCGAMTGFAAHPAWSESCPESAATSTFQLVEPTASLGASPTSATPPQAPKEPVISPDAEELAEHERGKALFPHFPAPTATARPDGSVGACQRPRRCYQFVSVPPPREPARKV